VAKRLEAKNLSLEVRDDARDYLIEKGSSLEFGARPLRRAIEQHLEDMLAEELLKSAFQPGDTIVVKVVGEGDQRKLGFEVSRKESSQEAVPV
jgi:ATP-dependent Clp protease ATP-binding subunit ClpC